MSDRSPRTDLGIQRLETDGSEYVSLTREELIAEVERQKSEALAWEQHGQEETFARERIERTQLEVVRDLVEAVEPKLAAMNFYFGPQSRTAVGRESEDAWRRIRDAVKRGREFLDG